MSNFTPNNWRAIKAFYQAALPDILEAGQGVWGMDPYEWREFGIIHLTPIEEWLWHDIRSCGAVFYPQFPVLRYFVDFANPTAKVALECDGADFHDEAKDFARDRELQMAGWTVYRFPGWMCRTDQNPETGESGEAMKKMRQICEGHELGRWAPRKSPRGPELVRASDIDVRAEFARADRVRKAVEAAL